MGTITYNTTTYNAPYIFRATSGGTVFSANLAGGSAFDLFDDSAVADDAIYFSGNSSSNTRAWSDLNMDISTAMSGSDIVLIWEYRHYTGAWYEIESLQDDTNSFTTTGANTVRFPIQWEWRYGDVNSVRGAWVRCRIVSLTSISEGGANAATVVTAADGAVDIDGFTDGSPCRFDDVSDYLATNYSYLKPTQHTDRQFDFRQVVIHCNSRLFTTHEQIELSNGYNAISTCGANALYYLTSGYQVGDSSGRYGSNFFVNSTHNAYAYAMSSDTEFYGSELKGQGAYVGYANLGSGKFYDCNMECRPGLSGGGDVSNCKITLGGGTIQTGAFPSTFNNNKIIVNSQMCLVYQSGFTAVNLDYVLEGSSMFYFYQTYTDIIIQMIDLKTPLPDQEPYPSSTGKYCAIRQKGSLGNVGMVLNYDNGTTTYTDQTSEAASATADDVNVTGVTGDPEVNDAIYFGMEAHRINAKGEIHVTMGSVVNSDNTFIFEIYAGGTWREAVVWDGTEQFTQSGIIYISQYSDDGNESDYLTLEGENRLWCRARITEAGSSKPVITQMQSCISIAIGRWHIYEKYHVDVKVTDRFGNNLEDATVSLYYEDGTEQWTTTTDSDGVIEEQDPVITKDYYFGTSQGNYYEINQDSTPNYKIVIKKSGYKTYESDIVLTEKANLIIKLDTVLSYNQHKSVTTNL